MIRLTFPADSPKTLGTRGLRLGNGLRYSVLTFVADRAQTVIRARDAGLGLILKKYRVDESTAKC